MRLAEAFKPKDLESLARTSTVEALYRLAHDSTPEAAISDAVKLARKGERVTLVVAKELIANQTLENDVKKTTTSKATTDAPVDEETVEPTEVYVPLDEPVADDAPELDAEAEEEPGLADEPEQEQGDSLESENVIDDQGNSSDETAEESQEDDDDDLLDPVSYVEVVSDEIAEHWDEFPLEDWRRAAVGLRELADRIDAQVDCASGRLLLPGDPPEEGASSN